MDKSNQEKLLDILSCLNHYGVTINDVNFATGEVQFVLVPANSAEKQKHALEFSIVTMLNNALLVGGNRSIIPAIKFYREQTNAGLADAKRAVEEIGVRHGVGEMVANPDVSSGLSFRFF